jgi:hypothetical protein
MLRMGLPTTRIASCKTSMFIDYTLPRQFWITKMGNTTNNPGRPRIPT